MSAWRREVLEYIPQLRREIERIEDSLKLCRLLTEQMWMAYERADIIGDNISHSSEDEALISCIHAYAGQCMLREPTRQSNIAFLFYESLSIGIDAHIAKDFAKYISPEAFSVLHRQQILAGIVGANRVEKFVEDYAARRRESSQRDKKL